MLSKKIGQPCLKTFRISTFEIHSLVNVFSWDTNNWSVFHKQQTLSLVSFQEKWKLRFYPSVVLLKFMPSLHFSVKMKLYRDFVVKLLVNLGTISKFTYVSKYNRLPYLINPYKPSVPFLGSMQTVQTQIRVFTVCLQEFLFKIEQKWKNTPDTSEIENGLVQLTRVDGSTGQMWLKLNHFSALVVNNLYMNRIMQNL